MNILGTYSGIGMETVDQLIAAEKAKGVRFTNKQSKIEDQQAAWKDIGSRLDSLYSKIDALQKGENFSSQIVRSNINNSPFLSVSTNEKATSGTYRMEVEQLATSSRLRSAKHENISSIDDKLVTKDGKLTITTADEKDNFFEIDFTKDDSLKTVTEKINEQTKESGIKASIVDKHLILTDTKMGSRKIEVGGDLAAELKLTTGSDHKDGIGARFSIDGLLIESNSNTIDGVIEGLTINLTSKHTSGEGELITVSHDTQKTVDVVKEFIDQYNSVIDFIGKQTDAGDPTAEKNKKGSLVGESSLIRLQSSLRNLLTRNLKTSSEDKQFNLSELGIEVDRYGVATLDEEALKEKVLEDPANVARAFYQPDPANVEGLEATGKSGKTKGGMTEQLKDLVESYTSKSKGIIKNKQESYDQVLKDIAKQIETFDARIERKRAQYIREFTALDQAMMQAESQMAYLYSQMNMGQD